MFNIIQSTCTKLPCGFFSGEEGLVLRPLAVGWFILCCHDSVHSESVVGGERDRMKGEVNTAAETIAIVAPVEREGGRWEGGKEKEGGVGSLLTHR